MGEQHFGAVGCKIGHPVADTDSRGAQGVRELGDIGREFGVRPCAIAVDHCGLVRVYLRGPSEETKWGERRIKPRHD